MLKASKKKISDMWSKHCILHCNAMLIMPILYIGKCYFFYVQGWNTVHTELGRLLTTVTDSRLHDKNVIIYIIQFW